MTSLVPGSRALQSYGRLIVSSDEDDDSTVDAGGYCSNSNSSSSNADDEDVLLDDEDHSQASSDYTDPHEQIHFSKPSRSILDTSLDSGSSNESLTFSDYYEVPQDVMNKQQQQNRQQQKEKWGRLETSNQGDGDMKGDHLLLTHGTCPSSPTRQSNAPVLGSARVWKYDSPLYPTDASEQSLTKMLVRSRRAHFANVKLMSETRMEMTMDTVFKAHDQQSAQLTCSQRRRLSFGYVEKQAFDKAAPACAIVQGCLQRMEEWDPSPQKGSNTSKPTKLRSILKKMKRRLSFFGKSNKNNKSEATYPRSSDAAPKQPGRRGSLDRSSGELSPSCHFATQTPARPQSQDAGPIQSTEHKRDEVPRYGGRRRGSFLGGRRFSNGGNQATPAATKPPQKPGRRFSLDGGMERRGSWLGRRLSIDGAVKGSPQTTSVAAKAPRRRSWLACHRVFTVKNHSPSQE